MEIGTHGSTYSWNGTTDEALALLHALRAHRNCRLDDGRTVAACAGHTMLATDQRAVDGLLFMRRLAEQLLAEEFAVRRYVEATSTPL